jgi:hypothetical protein
MYLNRAPSIKELVLERVLVPDPIQVEHEYLAGLHVSEYHVGVEHVADPQQFAGDHVGVDSLQVFDINNNAAHLPEKVGLVEHDLFCVREQLGVESEVVQEGHFPGQ